MPCQLRPAPTGIRKFLVVTGATVGIRIESQSKLAKLTSATFADAPFVVTNENAVSFTVPEGPNLLMIVVISPDASDTIRLLEDCGAGQNQQLDEYPYDPNDPVRGYRIAGA